MQAEDTVPCSQGPPITRSCATFCNMLCFYGELLAHRSTPKLEDHPLSVVRYCLCNAFAATLTTRLVSGFTARCTYKKVALYDPWAEGFIMHSSCEAYSMNALCEGHVCLYVSKSRECILIKFWFISNQYNQHFTMFR